MDRGLAATIGAFFIWGIFPLYWMQLAQVPALEIMSHRLVWCFVFVWGWLLLREGKGWWKAPLQDPRNRRMLFGSGLLIGANWWIFIWAVTNGHIVEASLGYFINPLVNIAMGTVLLREKLNRAQWLAIAIAAVGVLWLATEFGRPPWIALCLAFSFGSYGLLRKLTPVGAVSGLGLETALLTPLALGLLLWLGWTGQGHFGRVSFSQDCLLALGGAVTAIPLVLFAYGARRIPYSTVGIVQYLGPSLQLLIGVAVYGEAFPQSRLLGFALIWTALAIYASDGLWRYRQQRRALRVNPAG